MDEIEIGPLERKWGAAVEAGIDGPCLTGPELIDFVERGEAATSFAKGVAHLSQCPQCRHTVLEMRSAEDAVSAANNVFRFRLPRFGLLRPLALLSAAAILAVGSAFVLTKWSSNRLVSARSKPESHVSVAMSTPHSDAIESRTTGGSLPSSRSSRATNLRTTPAAREALVTPRDQLGADTPKNRGDRFEPNTAIASKDSDDPSIPGADQQYCLVGSDGVFAMPSPTYKQQDRQKIEEKYADQVKAAHDSYASRASANVDSVAETARLNQELQAAGDRRDQELAAIYKRQDDFLDRTLDLKIEGGAPYQVVEVDYRRNRVAREPVRFVVYPPWPGYAPVRRPYGWDYGVPYEPLQFKSRYVEWRRSYVAQGQPAFWGLVGHAGAVKIDNVFGSRYRGYASRSAVRPSGASPPGSISTPLGGYAHALQPADKDRKYGEGTKPTWNGYTHSPSPPDRSGSYTHSARDNSGSSGYSHSAVPVNAPHGYSHSTTESDTSGRSGRSPGANGYSRSRGPDGNARSPGGNRLPARDKPNSNKRGRERG
jgi:hypothetical protein